MFLGILILLLLFVLGLMTTNLPPKKFPMWFQSLTMVKNPPRATTGKAIAEEKQKEQRCSYMTGKDELKNVFATFDKNNDGFITKQELRDSLRNIGILMAEKDIVEMVKNVDSNGDGLIDLDEFCESFASLLSKEEIDNGEGRDQKVSGNCQEGDLKDAFDVFDGDRDGLITVEELGSVLSSLGFQEGNKLEDCKEMISMVDMDGDGMVSFDEFKMMMKAGHRLVPVA